VRLHKGWIEELYLKEYINKTSAKDYYWENGQMVMTEDYHLSRGYCCKNGCRHCPYEKTKSQSENSAR
tara:strand:+ start:540 stop:743 length:204 start_codon:yes stop_codon:yes gene_type:complete